MKQKKLKDNMENLKENIEIISLKQKETIQNIIDSSSRSFEASLDANKNFIDSLEKQIFNSDYTDNNILSEVKKMYGNSVELSEEAIDIIIDIQTKQLQSAIDFNVKIAEIIRNLDFSEKEHKDELLEEIEKNFEESSHRLIENSKKITEIYNKHINLAVNFNERFSKKINGQLQVLNIFQNKNMDMFNDWATQWWKGASKEEVAV